MDASSATHRPRFLLLFLDICSEVLNTVSRLLIFISHVLLTKYHLLILLVVQSTRLVRMKDLEVNKNRASDVEEIGARERPESLTYDNAF